MAPTPKTKIMHKGQEVQPTMICQVTGIALQSLRNKLSSMRMEAGGELPEVEAMVLIAQIQKAKNAQKPSAGSVLRAYHRGLQQGGIDLAVVMAREACKGDRSLMPAHITTSKITSRDELKRLNYPEHLWTPELLAAIDRNAEQLKNETGK